MSRKERKERSRLKVLEMKRRVAKAGSRAMAYALLEGKSEEEAITLHMEAFEKELRLMHAQTPPQEIHLFRKLTVNLRVEGWDNIEDGILEEVHEEIRNEIEGRTGR